MHLASIAQRNPESRTQWNDGGQPLCLIIMDISQVNGGSRFSEKLIKNGFSCVITTSISSSLVSEILTSSWNNNKNTEDQLLQP